MTYSPDFRWRAVSLRFVYGLDLQFISDVLGPKPRTILRWYKLFLAEGTVEQYKPSQRTARWPPDVLAHVTAYIKHHPTFYLEELQDNLMQHLPSLKNVSLATVCRALHFDLNMSRKRLTRAARECIPAEVATYKAKLAAIYSFPVQLLFIDETSKDGRHAYRRYGWSSRGSRCVVKLPFRRGKRRSILACLDHRGFASWETTEGTFTRRSFHAAFSRKVVPLLNPWPLPRSIVIMDNAKIHMYPELVEAVHQAGARLLFLPPYSPQLNPIEVCFGRLKAWIQRYANLVFPTDPDGVLQVAMRKCLSAEAPGALNLYGHCGYDVGGLRAVAFEQLLNEDE